jgi:hypothetical protein
MKFTIHCFDIPVICSTKGHKKLDTSKFWKDAESKIEGIKKAKGAYIFGLQHGKSYTPVYVGKTDNCFYSEALHPHKELHYTNCINDERKRKPIIILIAALTDKGGFSSMKNDYSKRLMDWLETFLIGYALRKNKDLYNTSKTQFLKKVSMPDILNSAKGESTGDSRILKQMLDK